MGKDGKKGRLGTEAGPILTILPPTSTDCYVVLGHEGALAEAEWELLGRNVRVIRTAVELKVERSNPGWFNSNILGDKWVMSCVRGS